MNDISNPRVPFRLAEVPARQAQSSEQRLLVHVVVNVEHWLYDQPMPRAALPPPHGRDNVPDVCNFSWAEYGIRCGLPRMIEMFRAYDIPVSASINLDVLKVYADAALAMRDAGWDFIGHGLRQHAVVPEKEAAMVAKVAKDLGEFTGRPLKGWLSPGLRQTHDSIDILAAHGITHCLDWGIDDFPSWMNSESGNIMAMPYSMELNDSVVFAVQHQEAADFERRVADTLEFFRTSRAAPDTAVIGIGLHPHLIGVPHRLVHLEHALQRLKRTAGVEFTTAREIATWFQSRNPAPARKAVSA